MPISTLRVGKAGGFLHDHDVQKLDSCRFEIGIANLLFTTRSPP